MADDAAADAAMSGEEPPPAAEGGEKKEEKKEEKEEANRIMVYARLRPIFKRDLEDPAFEEIVNLLPDRKSIQLTEGKSYTFDGTFGMKSEQIPVWQAIGRPVVENVFKGYSGCMLCYGQTGTGKSHTMSNMTKGEEGLVMQSMMHIFEKMESDDERQYKVDFSYLQIYLDKVQDLMNPASGNLDITRNDDGEVTIPGLVSRDCTDRENFVKLYEEGDLHRIVAATKMNPVSSRSHSCLMIKITSSPKGDDGTGETRTAKMWMIDLAGYERFSKTGVLEGIRKEEAKCINGSLLSLGNVIQGLAEKQSHVPWRNAKLTRLLQDAIGGKAKASICITLGPSGASKHETLGTLYFGSRAMAVKTAATLQVNMDYKALCAKLQAMLEEEQEKVGALEIAATKRQIENEQREERMQRQLNQMKTRHDEQLKKLIESGADATAIEAMIAENAEEEEIVVEQQRQERVEDEERHDEEIQEVVRVETETKIQEKVVVSEEQMKQIETMKEEMEAMKEEVERLKSKEEECTQLNTYITTLKEEHSTELMRAKEEAALNSGVSKEGLEQLKVEYDRQLKSIRSMMETTHDAQMVEMDELHQKEIDKLKRQLRENEERAADEFDQMKDALTVKMEEEVASVKAKAADVQEKLKRNHIIIKNSYQEQKEKLKSEIALLKEGRSGELELQEAVSKDNMRALTDKMNTIKKNYQEQIEKLKAENRALSDRLEAGGHVDPNAEDADE